MSETSSPTFRQGWARLAAAWRTFRRALAEAAIARHIEKAQRIALRLDYPHTVVACAATVTTMVAEAMASDEARS